MNDIQRLLAAAALLTFASVGCSSSGSGNGNGTGGTSSGGPNPPPGTPPAAGTLGIAKAANDAQFVSPFDATPDPDGKFIYFTAVSLAGGPAVYKVGADGQGLTQLFAGDPLVSPFGISITDDGKTLVIADCGAESDTDERGAVFSMGVGGGAPVALAGTQGTLPRGVEVRGDSIYYTGISGAAPKSVGAVYKMPVAGGSPTALASGDPLREPAGIAVTKTGDVYVLDAAGSSTRHASVFKLAGGAPSEIARDITVGFPSGLALSADESAVVVSALDDTLGMDAVYTVPVGGGDMALLGDAVQKTIGSFGESSGLHRARNTGVFAWADGRANKTGTVYVLK
jgi:hypothetical protein